MKSITVLSNLLHHLYHEIQWAKLTILSTAKYLYYSMKYTDFRCGTFSLKAHNIYYEFSIRIKFPQYVTKVVSMTKVLIFVTWLELLIYRCFKIDKCHLEHFAPTFVCGQNDSEGVVE